MTFRWMVVPLTALLTSLPLAGALQTPVPRATAELRDARGTPVGRATLTEGAPGIVTIRVTLVGLRTARAGEHGIHLHAVGQCTPTFAAAGGHFNPTTRRHGFLSREGPHGGDLPNIRIGRGGNATYEVKTSLVALGEGANSLFDADGTALIIHAAPDDYLTDPAGASGDRIACGVIRRSS